MDSVFETAGKSIVIIGIVMVLVFLMAYPVMWAMNWLFAPQFLFSVFGVTTMTFWRTWVLAFVTGHLFKSHNWSKE